MRTDERGEGVKADNGSITRWKKNQRKSKESLFGKHRRDITKKIGRE